MLPRAVAEALEVVVEPVNPLHALSRGLRISEGQDVSEVARVDVLLSSGSRVEVEIAFKVARVLQDLRDVTGARLYPSDYLGDVRRALLVEAEDKLLLRV